MNDLGTWRVLHPEIWPVFLPRLCSSLRTCEMGILRQTYSGRQGALLLVWLKESQTALSDFPWVHGDLNAPLPLLYLGSPLYCDLMILSAVFSSLPISFHPHICLSSPCMFTLFLAESTTEYSIGRRNLGGRRSKVEWLVSLWSWDTCTHKYM